MRIFKRLIVSVLLLSVVATCFSGCLNKSPVQGSFEQDGVRYDKVFFYLFGEPTERSTITGIDDSDNPEDMKSIYISDRVLECYVQDFGKYLPNNNLEHCSINISKTERIYFPWSLRYGGYMVKCINKNSSRTMLITASIHDTINFFENQNVILVVPAYLYPKLLYGEAQIISEEIRKDKGLIFPANISYFFNYERNPNEGYFFVDLLEETGKLTPPPYNPHREGYTFEGWYKDAECTEAWDFANDEVTIFFNEVGNRVYEEIGLYAKWTKIESSKVD